LEYLLCRRPEYEIGPIGKTGLRLYRSELTKSRWERNQRSANAPHSGKEKDCTAKKLQYQPERGEVKSSGKLNCSAITLTQALQIAERREGRGRKVKEKKSERNKTIPYESGEGDKGGGRTLEQKEIYREKSCIFDGDQPFSAGRQASPAFNGPQLSPWKSARGEGKKRVNNQPILDSNGGDQEGIHKTLMQNRTYLPCPKDVKGKATRET